MQQMKDLMVLKVEEEQLHPEGTSSHVPQHYGMFLKKEFSRNWTPESLTLHLNDPKVLLNRTKVLQFSDCCEETETLWNKKLRSVPVKPDMVQNLQGNVLIHFVLMSLF